MNAAALKNIFFIVVTRETFQEDMSALNEALFANKLDMSVITDTSHSPMAGEHTPTGDEERHAFTVVTNSALVNGLYADATDNGQKYNTITDIKEYVQHIIFIYTVTDTKKLYVFAQFPLCKTNTNS